MVTTLLLTQRCVSLTGTLWAHLNSSSMYLHLSKMIVSLPQVPALHYGEHRSDNCMLLFTVMEAFRRVNYHSVTHKANYKSSIYIVLA